MMPTDNNNSDNNQPKMPIVTHLRRVVDMTTIDKPQNAKKTRTPRQGKSSASERPAPVRKQAAQTPAESPAKKREGGKRVVARPANDEMQQNSATAERKAAAERKVAPARRIVADATKKTRKVEPIVVRQENNAQPEQLPDPGRSESLPENSVSETRASAKRPAIKAVHATRMVKGIKRPTIHVSEKTATVHRERLSLKPKHKNAEKTGAVVPQVNTQNAGISEKIDEALMLQSWRARQWSASIVALSPTIATQIPKCMPFVQAKLVNNVCITTGSIESTVVDQVTSVSLRQFTPGQWRAVINMLSDRAIFTTSLLNGELPEGIVDIFKQASLSLFPTKIREFSFNCTCNPQTVPCEHACALLLAFAQELEEDPFQILTLRGMTRDNLLALMRDARSDQVVDERNRHRINYELPAQNVDFTEFYAPQGSFDDLNFHIHHTSNALLRRLGDPEAWNAPFPLIQIVDPVKEIASQYAEKLGLCEFEEIAESAPDFANLRRQIRQETPVREHESRSPRKSSRTPQFVMPDLEFVQNALPPDIREALNGDPAEIAADILRWLKNRGASDIRTLARRTRLHKTTIEAFLNAMCIAGITAIEGDGDRIRYVATF